MWALLLNQCNHINLISKGTFEIHINRNSEIVLFRPINGLRLFIAQQTFFLIMKLSKILFPLLLVLFAGFQSCSDDDPIDPSLDLTEVSELSPEVLTEWTRLYLDLERSAIGMRPNASARAAAYVNLAAYEVAVAGMEDFDSNEGRLEDFNVTDLNVTVDWNIALNTAYADVIEHFLFTLPDTEAARIGEFETAFHATLSNGVGEDVINASIEWGAVVAQEIIAFSQTDTEAETQILDPQPTSFIPPIGEGFWTFNAEPERALFPFWESVRTFIVSNDETTTVAPIPYSTDPTSAFYLEMMEVYNVNNTAMEEDNEELWIAEFWGDDADGLTFSPPARQIAIANQLVDYYDLDLAEALHMMVKVGFSLNDAAVAAWRYKYEHMVMRPSEYIHEYIDPEFQTNLFRLVFWPNPSFPGYPSGHSTFASAAGGVFIDLFGDDTDFTDLSHERRTEFRGAPRNIQTFSHMAEENAFSRIPLGVHVRMDCVEGLRLGYEISFFLSPKSGL